MYVPIISIIIPVYNAESFLDECITSVLNQSFQDYEIICVDDGSTDHSCEIITNYRDTYSKIKLIKQTNQYAGVARNRGIDEASGEYVLFLDSDDCLECNALERLYSIAVDTGAEVVRASGYDFDEFGEKRDVDWSLRKCYFSDGQVFTWKDMSQSIFQISAGNPWGMLVQRKLICDNNIRFLELPRTEDIYFVYDAYLKANKIAVIFDQLVFHRPSEKSMESTKVNFPLVPLEARHNLLDKIKTEGYYDDVYIGFWFAAFNSYIQMVRLLIKSKSSKDLIRPYYDDIKSAVLLHPDLIIDKGSPFYPAISSIYVDLYKIINSSDFNIYYSNEIQVVEELEYLRICKETRVNENFRKKESIDLERLIIANNSHIGHENEPILFSVVIPVYNAEKYLKECLDHLVNQSYSNLEIICVDDGSTDNSCSIIESYPSVTLIRQENSGAGLARNNGFQKSHGDYVLFMDGDDWAEYDLFMKVFRYIQDSNATLDMIMYSYTRFDDVTGEFKPYYNLEASDTCILSNLDKSPELFLNNNLVIPWNKVIRSDFIREYGLKFPDFKCSNDRPFYFASLVHAENILVVNDVLINYRVNSKSVISVSRLKNFDCHYQTYRLVAEEYRKCQASINSRFIDTTLSDMFHFYDTSGIRYRETIGHQICEYSDSMHLDEIDNVETYWWYKKLIQLKIEYNMPILDVLLKKTSCIYDRSFQYLIATAYLSGNYEDKDHINAIGALMIASDMGNSDATRLLKTLYVDDVCEKTLSSLDLCMILSKRGNRSAQYRVAKMYRDGIGVTKDVDVAREYMKKAAEQGHTGAKMGLVELYYSSSNPVDHRVAFEICFNLAEKGNKDAQFRLSRMYFKGIGVCRDTDKSNEWLKKAADNGHLGAKKELKNVKPIAIKSSEKKTQTDDFEYLKTLVNIGTSNAYAEIVSYCAQQAEKNNPIASYYLYCAYSEGKGVERDDRIAKCYYDDAIKNGSFKEDFQLYHELWIIGSTDTLNLLFSFISNPNDVKYSEAMHTVGMAYRDGIGVEKDLDKSLDWMRKAYQLKVKYLNDYLLSLWMSHTAEAIDELNDSCITLSENGNVVAIRYLARIYHERGAYAISKEYYRKALYLKPELIIHEYTDILYTSGTKEDLRECMSISKEFSLVNNKDALYRLGKMYLDGRGVGRDYTKARDLLCRASDAGSKLAAVELNSKKLKTKKHKGIFSFIKIRRNGVHRGAH